MSSIVFIVGPTATGKSEVAFNLAKKLSAEIISCDAMQVYREPRIITAKPSDSIVKNISHHFLGTVSVEQAYNVYDYSTAAIHEIRALHAVERAAIVCGGSGLYVKALLDGLFAGPGRNDYLRADLERRARDEGSQVLHAELMRLDKTAGQKISPNDLRRIVRALEVFYAGGVPISQKKQEARGLWGELPITIFGLRLKRDVLYARINRRTEQMFEAGAVDEVTSLLALPLSLTAQKIIGVKEIKSYLDGTTTENEAKELMKKNTRNYAKRQMTWFNKDKRVNWIDVDNLTPEDTARKISESL